MKVLNVEDNPIKHCQIRRALEQCGVKEVDCCNNLQDALYLLEERTGMGRRYDLIVTDMNYPLETGGRIIDSEDKGRWNRASNYYLFQQKVFK